MMRGGARGGYLWYAGWTRQFCRHLNIDGALQPNAWTHLPIAWKPWGPVAGKAKRVNASMRYLCLERSVSEGRR